MIPILTGQDGHKPLNPIQQFLAYTKGKVMGVWLRMDQDQLEAIIVGLLQRGAKEQRAAATYMIALMDIALDKGGELTVDMRKAKERVLPYKVNLTNEDGYLKLSMHLNQPEDKSNVVPFPAPTEVDRGNEEGKTE